MGFLSGITKTFSNITSGISKAISSVTPKIIDTLKTVAGHGLQSAFEGIKSGADNFLSKIPLLGKFVTPLADKLLDKGSDLLKSLADKGINGIEGFLKGLSNLTSQSNTTALENGTTVTTPGIPARGTAIATQQAAMTSAAQQAAQTTAATTASSTPIISSTSTERLDAFFQRAGLSDAEITAIKNDPAKSADYKLQAMTEENNRYTAMMTKVSDQMKDKQNLIMSMLSNIK